MNQHDPGPDDDLRRLLDDAVAGVEPADRLGEIRSRTRTTSSRRRGWLVAGGGVLAAAAAAAVAVAVVAGPGPDDGVDEAADPTPPAASTSAPTATSQPPSGDPSALTAPEPGQPAGTTPVYYVGDGPDGPDAPAEVLYRYFEPAGDPLELLMSEPTDPDYRTLWPEGSLQSYEVDDDRIVVQVAEDGEDPLARQQLIYTMQAVTGTYLPVDVENPAVNLERVERAPALEVLSHVGISDPGEGFEYDDDFLARGRANGFEGNVACDLTSAAGDVVWTDATIAGSYEDRLFPWGLRVDVGRAAPGRYVFECRTEDPAGGPTYSDTRTITVE